MQQLPSPTSLADVLNFTLDDLAANRAGEISPRQQEILREEDAEETRSLLFGIAILTPIVLMACGLCAALVNIGAILSWAGDALLAVAGFIGLIMLAVLYVSIQGRRERRHMPDVIALEGPLHLHTDYQDTREIYYVDIDGKAIKIDGMVMEGLRVVTSNHVPEQRYRIYYTPQADKILSAETIAS